MKILTKNIYVTLAIIFAQNLIAQVGINLDGSPPDSTAILDVKSNSKGLLTPRLSLEEIQAIVNPANGLLVFNVTDGKFYVYASLEYEWKEIQYGTGVISPPWVCGNPISYEGQNYTTVQIGTQCWMSENLNVGTRIDGVDNQTDNSILEKYCYADDLSNCSIYGGLYQWNELMQYVSIDGAQGICPVDWHVPTNDEFKTLEMYLGMSQMEANQGGWRGTNEGSKLAGNEVLWVDGNLDSNAGFGESGFNLIPGGWRHANTSFFSIAENGYLWLSTEVNAVGVYTRNLNYSTSETWSALDRTPERGFSVRCIKD